MREGRPLLIRVKDYLSPHPPATKKPRKIAKLLPKANDAGTNKESFDGLEVRCCSLQKFASTYVVNTHLCSLA